MTQADPKMRPSVDKAIQQFEKIISDTKRLQLCLPLRPVQKPVGRYTTAYADKRASLREYKLIMKEDISRVFLWLYGRGRIVSTYIRRPVSLRRHKPIPRPK